MRPWLFYESNRNQDRIRAANRKRRATTRIAAAHSHWLTESGDSEKMKCLRLHRSWWGWCPYAVPRNETASCGSREIHAHHILHTICARSSPPCIVSAPSPESSHTRRRWLCKPWALSHRRRPFHFQNETRERRRDTTIKVWRRSTGANRFTKQCRTKTTCIQTPLSQMRWIPSNE